MTRLLSPSFTLAAAALALGAGGAAAASTTSTSIARTINVSKQAIVNYDGTRTASASARLVFPAKWALTKESTPSKLVLREGFGSCIYTVTASTATMVSDAADARAAIVSLAPASGSYVLESGTRNSAAWRVTRIQDSLRTRLHAVRVVPSAGLDSQLKLGAGMRGFQTITIDAISGAGDECHSGTYRDVAGPIIGDALATTRTRAYVDFEPGR